MGKDRKTADQTAEEKFNLESRDIPNFSESRVTRSVSFVSEPMDEKALTEVPGVGPEAARRLNRIGGFKTVSVMQSLNCH